MECPPSSSHSLQRRLRSRAVRGYRHGKTIDHDILRSDSIALCLAVYLSCDSDSPFRSLRYSALIQRERHHHPAILGRQRKNCIHTLLLPIDRINQSLAVVAAEPPLQRRRICCVQLQRQCRDRLKTDNNPLQQSRLINIR